MISRGDPRASAFAPEGPLPLSACFVEKLRGATRLLRVLWRQSDL